MDYKHLIGKRALTPDGMSFVIKDVFGPIYKNKYIATFEGVPYLCDISILRIQDVDLEKIKAT